MLLHEDKIPGEGLIVMVYSKTPEAVTRVLYKAIRDAVVAFQDYSAMKPADVDPELHDDVTRLLPVLLSMDSQTNDRILEIPLENLDMSRRLFLTIQAYNKRVKSGNSPRGFTRVYENLGDLVESDLYTLRKTPGIGKKALNEIISIAKSHGYEIPERR